MKKQLQTKKLLLIGGIILFLLWLWGTVAPAGNSKPHGLKAPTVTLASAQIPPPKTLLNALNVRDPWSDADFTGRSSFAVSDKVNATMFWVNGWGAQSGEEPFCVIDYAYRHPIICLGGFFGRIGASPVIVFYRPGTSIPERVIRG